MANIMKIVTEAGVSKKTRDPFSSMEVNDQINGTNGKVLDDVASVSAKIIKQKTLNVAGITRVPYIKDFSTAYRN